MIDNTSGSMGDKRLPLFQRGNWETSLARKILLEKIGSLKGSEVTLVVPPPAQMDRPSLSLHLLQACAQKDNPGGVSVFYANLPFGAWIGEEENMELSFLHPGFLLNERLFAAPAFDVPPMGRNGKEAFEEIWQKAFKSREDVSLSYEDLLALARDMKAYVEDIAHAIVGFGSRVVGCTTIFEQRASSIAILRAVKRLDPKIVTILGGPNCLGGMAAGMADLAPSVDYIFSGESEHTFPEFLNDLRKGKRPAGRIVQGAPCLDLDKIPTPNYDQFYEQQSIFLGETPRIWLPYETSRGCWWGEKKPCTFCGLNGEFINHRVKSASRVFQELETLIGAYKPAIVMNYDNLMPFSYFQEVLPALKEKHQEVAFFYEQRANLDLKRMGILKEARVDVIQPGIEAVSTSLLKRMNKGVTGPQNIAALRYGRSWGVTVNWSLLYAFPGDSLEDYRETLAILPFLRHLSPPLGMDSLDFERFSPYCTDPDGHGLKNMRPLKGYFQIFPEGIRPEKIAYNFTCDYESAAFDHPECMESLRQEVYAWRRAWMPDGNVFIPKILKVTSDIEEGGYPLLHVRKTGEGTYGLVDTRQGAEQRISLTLDKEQALAALVSMPLGNLRISEQTRKWALDNRVAIVQDNTHVALATASPELLRVMEEDIKKRQV